MTANPTALTIREYADLVRKNPVYVTALCREGKIPGAVKVHGNWLIPLSAVPQQFRPVPPAESARDHQRRADAAANALAAL